MSDLQEILDDFRLWVDCAEELRERYHKEGNAYKIDACEVAYAAAARVTLRRLDRHKAQKERPAP